VFRLLARQLPGNVQDDQRLQQQQQDVGQEGVKEKRAVRVADLKDLLLRFNCRPDWTEAETAELLALLPEDDEQMLDFNAFVAAISG
jgi:hypothetical protein